jgi:multiple sugar transport system permease protein
VLVFLVFVVYPVCNGLWIARRPESYVALFDDPIFARSVVNTLVFLIVGINLKMVTARCAWIRWFAAIFILLWALPSIPTILSIRFMLNPEWGLVNSVIFRLTGEDGPNWLNDPTLALLRSSPASGNRCRSGR